MLNDLKLILDIKHFEEDEKLKYILKSSTNIIMELTNFKSSSPQLNDLIIEFAILRYNRLGSEGLSSESYSGVSQSFNNDIPEDLMRRIKRIRKLPR